VLDVATGTGDLALELARRVAPGGEVIGSDFSEPMLERARAKARSRASAGVCFERADALALPYRDGRFDAATVGFGARNFADLQRGLNEMARVVRPGGKVVVLEITTPARGALARFYGLWFDRLVPALGRLAGAVLAGGRSLRRAPGSAGVADAYLYLPRSVKRFPAPALLAAQMEQAGLTRVSYVLMAGGIVAIHVGTVQSTQARAQAPGRSW